MPKSSTSFQPGKSGNPGGRVKKDERLRRIEDMAKEHSEEALGALLDEAQNGKGAPRVAAATALLDRAWGKPVERQESGEPGAFTADVGELRKRVAERGAKLGLNVVPIKKQI